MDDKVSTKSTMIISILKTIHAREIKNIPKSYQIPVVPPTPSTLSKAKAPKGSSPNATNPKKQPKPQNLSRLFIR